MKEVSNRSFDPTKRLATLNYQHLLYFWTVAREGGLAPASRVLRLARPTLSGQIRSLEERLEHKLFDRVGRRLVLTEVGHVVFGYAEEIFTLGRELLDTVHGSAPGRRARLDVGIVDVVPKLVVRDLLEPALQLKEPVRLVCHEGPQDRLLARLALHELDLVIADAPVPAGSTIRAFNHLLAECDVTFFAARSHAGLRRGFPRSLDDAPMLLPIEGSPLRRSLDQWLLAENLHPKIIGEFEDSALLKVFGSDGFGVFPGPTSVAKRIIAQYDVAAIGRTERVRERFYAISAERRLRHPAVVAISDAQRGR